MSHHIKGIKKGDTIYAVHQDDDGKVSKHVAVVKKVLESSYIALPIKTAHYNSTTVELQHDDVQFNLGPGGHDFKIADTNLAENFTLHTTEHPSFGRLNWSFKPEEEVEKKVHKAYSGTAKFLKANGLEGVFELPIIYEVYHKLTKYAGYYKSSKNLAQKPGFLRFSPLHEGMSIEHSMYVAAHEVGHVIHSQVLTKRPKLLAKWIEMYQETVAPLNIDKELLVEMRDMLKSAESLTQYRAQLKSDDAKVEANKAVFDYLNKAHGLRPFDVEVILLAEGAAKIDAYWPKSSACFTRQLKPSVSEYATKNVNELFAESFAFYACDHKLPRAIKDLMEESIQKAAKSLPNLIKDIESGGPADGDSE